MSFASLVVALFISKYNSRFFLGFKTCPGRGGGGGGGNLSKNLKEDLRIWMETVQFALGFKADGTDRAHCEFGVC